MSATEAEASTAPPGPEPAPEPAPVLSRAVRRSGRRGTRVLALVSLATALGATGWVVTTAADLSAPAPLEQATDAAWSATGALSDALRELEPGASRAPARPLAKEAAAAVEASRRRVEALELPLGQTPLRARVLRALRADAAWIDAVGSTLANPRSPRRAELAALAQAAAQATAVVAGQVADARGTVGGTGRLLSSTQPAVSGAGPAVG